MINESLVLILSLIMTAKILAVGLLLSTASRMTIKFSNHRIGQTATLTSLNEEGASEIGQWKLSNYGADYFVHTLQLNALDRCLSSSCWHIEQ